MSSPYKRVLLKLSGEALAGEAGTGISTEILEQISEDISQACLNCKVQMGIVVGGGNIIRGVAASANGMDRASSDYMGMLGTCINGLALQDALEKKGLQTRLQSAIDMAEIAEPYIRRRAVRHFEKGRVVIFSAGTGNPYFTTDTAAALRAMEVNADILIKATKVDGIYDKDPVKYSDASKFDEISYLDVISKGLAVMDTTAITLCMENNLPIITFNLMEKGNIQRVISGQKIGTLVQA